MAGITQNDHTAQQQKEASVDLGSRFMWRLWRIMCIINAVPALSLVLISLAETVIVSKIGTISGLFYQGESSWGTCSQAGLGPLGHTWPAWPVE
jgi:hypothetical protein